MWLSVVHTELRGLENAQGTWVAQLVKCQTLDFSSGHDLMVCEIESQVWLCTGSVKPAWDSLSLSLSLSLCPSPACALSLSLKINKLKKIINILMLGGKGLPPYANFPKCSGNLSGMRSPELKGMHKVI